MNRKHHVPLPPAETIISALELSREHGQSVASTQEWMKGSCHAGNGNGGQSIGESIGERGRNNSKNRKIMEMERRKGRNTTTTTSPILKQAFFITQDNKGRVEE